MATQDEGKKPLKHRSSLQKKGLQLLTYGVQGQQAQVGPRGVLKFGLDGSLWLEPRNPYTCSRVVLTEKSTHF